MGDTNKEKVANFLIKADQFLTANQDDLNATSSVRTFVKFVGEYGKPISDYTTEDFSTFFNQKYRNANSFTSVKSKLKNFLKNVGEEDALQVLDSTKMTYKKDYLKSFKELADGIQASRFKQMPFLKYSPKPEYCDKLTMGEVILYCAWIGVPQNIIFQLPLSAMDLDAKVVHAGKDYSFADNKEIIEIFTKYKNSDTFVLNRTIRDKTHFSDCEYCGDGLIRAKKQTNTNINAKTLTSRIFSNFEFAKSYFNVSRSGQFCRGYEKYKKGIEPDFNSSEKIWEYFGITLSTDAEIYMFRKDWAEYLEWIRSE